MAKTRLVHTEREHHKQAFETYYALGLKRSHRAVANELGVSVSTIKSWSRSFRWRERIAERDAQVARAVANRSINDEVDHRERNLKIVQMSLARIAKAIVDRDVKMTLSDLDKLIRLEAFLRDEPDSRQEIVFPDLRNKSREELREMVRQEMEVLKELEAGEDHILPQNKDVRGG